MAVKYKNKDNRKPHWIHLKNLFKNLNSNWWKIIASIWIWRSKMKWPNNKKIRYILKKVKLEKKSVEQCTMISIDLYQEIINTKPKILLMSKSKLMIANLIHKWITSSHPMAQTEPLNQIKYINKKTISP